MFFYVARSFLRNPYDVQFSAITDLCDDCVSQKLPRAFCYRFDGIFFCGISNGFKDWNDVPDADTFL